MKTRATIGFKTKAQRNQEKESVKNSDAVSSDDEMIDVTPLQAETIERVEVMNEFICSKEFSKLESEDKQRVLSDFSYFSKVLEFI